MHAHAQAKKYIYIYVALDRQKLILDGDNLLKYSVKVPDVFLHLFVVLQTLDMVLLRSEGSDLTNRVV